MLDICLAVAGVIVIIASFVISDRAEDKKSTSENAGQVTEIWTSKDEQNVREHIEKILDETTEQKVSHAEDELDRLSNEKIMAVGEYSDQVLEKIAQNHKEVVFLYDMLNQKDQEMKTMVKTIDTTKTQAEEAALKVEEGVKKLKDLLKTQSNSGVEDSKRRKNAPIPMEGASMAEIGSAAETNGYPTGVNQAAVLKQRAESRGIGNEKKAEEAAPDPKKKETKINGASQSASSVRPVSAMTALERFALNKMIAEGKAVDPAILEQVTGSGEGSDNKNEQILKLYDEGKSILEIAKTLGLGQGEVKLVVNLFKNSKK